MKPGPVIMIIEDDVDLRRALSEVLTENGYEVVACDDGAVALNSIHRCKKPAMILLDLNMPNLDGWLFRTIQRQLDTTADIPVVVMSAAPRVDEAAMKLKASAWLAKPIHMRQLLAVVSRHCLQTA